MGDLDNPTVRRPRAAAWVTGLLAFSAFLAAEFLVSSMCYWEGQERIANGLRLGHGDIVPMAWTPRIAPAYVTFFTLSVLWAGCWFVRARQLHRAGASWLHSAIPMVVFWISAAQAWRMSYACNLF